MNHDEPKSPELGEARALFPLPEESLPSFAYRVARDMSMSLGQFLPLVLGQRWNGHSAIELPLFRGTPRLAEVTKVPIQKILDLQPQAHWVRNRVGVRSAPTNVFVCPECLAEGGIERRQWHTKVSLACAVHERFLVGSCDHCGHLIEACAHFCGAPAYWRDLWPMCPICEGQIGCGERVSGDLLKMTHEWERATYTVTEDGESLLRASNGIYDGLTQNTLLLQKCAQKVQLPAGCHVASLLTAKVARALVPAFEMQDSPLAKNAKIFARRKTCDLAKIVELVGLALPLSR